MILPPWYLQDKLSEINGGFTWLERGDSNVRFIKEIRFRRKYCDSIKQEKDNETNKYAKELVDLPEEVAEAFLPGLRDVLLEWIELNYEWECKNTMGCIWSSGKLL